MKQLLSEITHLFVSKILCIHTKHARTQLLQSYHMENLMIKRKEKHVVKVCKIRVQQGQLMIFGR